MHRSTLFALGLATLGFLGLQASDASACGGCFVQQSESTQVSGHRMVLSVSQMQTTLYDQITYAGNPQDFAWVLPTKGTVQVGLSSDALFETLEAYTQVTVQSPTIQCPPPPDCGDNFGSTGTGPSGAGGGGGGSVTVIAQEVVGPYETVQLSAADPNALNQWLLDHGYSVPADIKPVIDAYVAEQFNFLALKLVPGQGVNSMRPVRVTTNGATPVLPLRMVAAGTGVTTPITLWVMGEGRYEPANFPSFQIQTDELVWDWDTQSSNYKTLAKSKFDASQGHAWSIEAGEPFSGYDMQSSLLNLAMYDQPNSGYGDATGMGAVQEATDDMAALFAGIDMAKLWVSRLHGELSRPALGTDLEVGASADQSPVTRFFELTKSTGTAPACPQFPPCDTTSTGVGGSTATGPFDNHGNGDGTVSQASSTCAAIPGDAGFGDLFALGVIGAAAILVRRRRR